MDTYHQTEKAALIAVQSILNTRGVSPWEKVNRLRMGIGQLDPSESLTIFTQILIAFSERLNLSTPMSQWIKKTIVEFSTRVLSSRSTEPDRLDTARKLYEIISYFKRLSGCEFRDCGYNDENWRLLMEVIITMARRSADEASGIAVLPMSVPTQDLVKPPQSPKLRPSAENLIGLGKTTYHRRHGSAARLIVTDSQ